MSTKTKGKKESKFSKFMKGPVKILAGFRNFYERTLSGCAGHAGFESAMGPQQYPTFPESVSASSRGEDMKELIRIASTRSLTGKSEAELLPPPSLDNGGVTAVHRSRTVAFGRIDEDKPCEFGADMDQVYIKSRSTAAARFKY